MTIMFWTIPSWFTITDFRFIPIVVTAGHIAYTTSIYLGNVIWVIDFPICFFLICDTGRLTLKFKQKPKSAAVKADPLKANAFTLQTHLLLHTSK